MKLYYTLYGLGIFLFIVSIIIAGIDLKNSSIEKRNVNCYDSYNNKIIGAVCEENVIILKSDGLALITITLASLFLMWGWFDKYIF